MSNHPLNLTLRFLLELGILGGLGYWGWTQHEGIAQIALGIGLPLLGAAAWGIFRVPGDPGKAPVAVPGALRLLLELVLFGAAVGLLAAAGQPTAAAVFGALVVFHYLISYDRVRWLLTGR